MTKKLERIQSLLSSTDPELRKLGQKLCHEFRIDYYIECLPYSLKTVEHRFKVKWHPVNYSLQDIRVSLVQSWKSGAGIIVKSETTLQRIYKIELCKKS